MITISITSHARRRLGERLPGMNTSNYDSLLHRALDSRENSQTLIMLRAQNCEPKYKTKYKYRLLSEMVYVFQYNEAKDKALLITCFAHQDPESTQLAQEFNKWADGKSELQ